MVESEPGETQQSVCLIVVESSETDVYISDQEDLGLLLQVLSIKINPFKVRIWKEVSPCFDHDHLFVPVCLPDSCRTALTTV